MGAGPERLIADGLASRLVDAGHAVDVHLLEAPPGSWRAEIRTAFDLAKLAADKARVSIAAGAFPLVLSGNCLPAALGSVAALRRPSVVWLDAHGDYNTPETTIGGFLDGTALATVTGRCWREMTRGIGGFEPVPESSVALVGARDLDSLEKEALEQSGIRRCDLHELETSTPEPPVYFHLDLDVLDPAEARVNSYAAPGGPSSREVERMITRVAPRAASITAYDPALDVDGRTSAIAIRLALALAAAARADSS